MAVGHATDTIPQSLARWYDRLLIERERPYLRLMQFAQMRPMPGHTGDTAYFTGYRPLAKPSSALNETTNPTAVNYAARQLSATVEEWGQTAVMSKKLSMTKIDPGLVEQIDIAAVNAAETIEYQLAKLVAKQGVWGITSVTPRTTNIRTVTVSDSASNSTSVFQTTAATTCNAVSAIANFSGAIVTVVKDGLTASGSTVKYGYAGRVSSYAGSTTAGDKFRLKTAAPHSAAPEAFQSSDVIRIVSMSNVGAPSVVSNTHFAMAQRDLRVNHSRTFGDGYYGAVIPASVLYSLKLDSTWVNAASYSGITDLYRGEVGRWYGHRVVEATLPYREDEDGTENEATGAVYWSYFTGRNAFGHTSLEGGGRKIYTTQGPDSNEPIPRHVYVSWYQVYANRALTAPWCVGLVAGAAA